jgi:hypothetical protein
MKLDLRKVMYNLTAVALILYVLNTALWFYNQNIPSGLGWSCAAIMAIVVMQRDYEINKLKNK